jgi:hypothetical protein
VLAALVALSLGIAFVTYRSLTAKPAGCDELPELAETAPEPEFALDVDHNRVTRRNAWSASVPGCRGGYLSPGLAWDADRVYVPVIGGVTALDGNTGGVAWWAAGANDGLLASGGLLWAVDVDCGQWLTARTARTGQEASRVRLPAGEFRPLPLREVAGLILAQQAGFEDVKSVLADRDGKVRHRLADRVIGGVCQGPDALLLTDRGVVRLPPTGPPRWSISLDPAGLAWGDLVPLEGGDLVTYLYSVISDSGVEVVRFDPATGRTVWRAGCRPLGVTHSEYEHKAKVTVAAGRLRVASRGSGGDFVDVLDLETGRRLSRGEHVRSSAEEGPWRRFLRLAGVSGLGS